MKKKIVLTVMIVLGISIAYSQNSLLESYVSLKVKNKSIPSILDHISKQNKCYFTYNPEIINSRKDFTFSYDQIKIKEVLDIIFKNKNLKYEVIKDHIVIYKDDKTLQYIKTPVKTEKEYLEISGKIIDRNTKKEVPYVSIGLNNTTLGIVSNETGDFKFKIPKDYQDSSLLILHIGYENHYLPIKEILNEQFTVELVPDYVSIQEVIIRTKDPTDIINSAILKIKDNYIQTPVSLSAFYREGVVRRNNLLTFSEAVIKVLKQPYKTTVTNDKIKVLKSRKIINSQQIDTVMLKLQDGLYSGLMLDVVKNPVSFFELENLKKYKFNLTNIVTYDGIPTNVIEFDQKEGTETNLYKGKLYIESRKFALIEAEFEVIFNDIRSSGFVVRKNRKLNVKPLTAKYKVKYKKTGDKYILNHVRADLEFRVRKKREAFSSKYHAFFETAVFDVDQNNTEKFDKENVAKRNLVFIDNNYSYDAEFWGNYNFIKPEQSIKEAIDQIHAKLDFN